MTVGSEGLEDRGFKAGLCLRQTSWFNMLSNKIGKPNFLYLCQMGIAVHIFGQPFLEGIHIVAFVCAESYSVSCVKDEKRGHKRED